MCIMFGAFPCLLAHCSFNVYKLSIHSSVYILDIGICKNLSASMAQDVLDFVLGSITDTVCVSMLAASQNSR